MTAQTASQQRFPLRRGISLWLLVMLVQSFSPCEALNIGRRRIQCTTPVGGNSEADALMDPRPNLPYILGFVGFQAFLPSLGQCPPDFQIQPPWFTGIEGASGGICPPEYYNLVASGPGLVIIGAAVAWSLYIESNRLLVTKNGLGTMSTEDDMGGFEEKVLFSNIKDWFMTPVGLVIRSSSGTTDFFPLSWDSKGLEALLEERIPE